MNIHFKYNNKEEFYKLQDILLELGYEWKYSGKRRIEYSNVYNEINLNTIHLKDTILILNFEEECMEFYKGKINKDDIESFIEARKLNIL